MTKKGEKKMKHSSENVKSTTVKICKTTLNENLNTFNLYIALFPKIGQGFDGLPYLKTMMREKNCEMCRRARPWH